MKVTRRKLIDGEAKINYATTLGKLQFKANSCKLDEIGLTNSQQTTQQRQNLVKQTIILNNKTNLTRSSNSDKRCSEDANPDAATLTKAFWFFPVRTRPALPYLTREH